MYLTVKQTAEKLGVRGHSVQRHPLDAAAGAAERRCRGMKCKYEGTGVWAGRCTGTKEIDPCIGYANCSRFKGDYQTNADRIRAMSDEELAEFLAPSFTCYACPSRALCDKSDGKDCNQGFLEWLKQPYEEGLHGNE